MARNRFFELSPAQAKAVSLALRFAEKHGFYQTVEPEVVADMVAGFKQLQKPKVPVPTRSFAAGNTPKQTKGKR